MMSRGGTGAAVVMASLVVGLVGCAPKPPVEYQLPVAVPMHAPTAAPPPPGLMHNRLAPQMMMRGEPQAQFANAAENPIQSVADQPVSTFSADVDAASYSVIRRFLEDGRMPPADAVRVEEVINYFRYDYPAGHIADAGPFTPMVQLYPSPWRPGAEILHIAVTTRDVPAEARPPATLVFLVDVSGSMNMPDRLPLVQRSLRMMLDGLRDDDQVALVTYAGHNEVVLGLTPGTERARIATAIDRLSAAGATGGEGGLRTAYALAEAAAGNGRISRVVLATDGDFNLGLQDPKALADFIAQHRQKGVFLTVLGVGADYYRDDVAQALAQAGDGQAFYVDTLHEARRALREQLGSTLQTVATDVKLQVEFNPAQVAEYRLIGYETRMLRTQDFNDDRVDAGDVGAGHRVTALYEIVAPNSPVRMLDPLRYATPSAQPATAGDGAAEEVAFLKLRWKQPGQADSTLYTRPITPADRVATVTAAAAEVRFAAAAAAYGQKLRQSSFTKGYAWAEVEALAAGARGADPNGERAEFIKLVRLATLLDR